MIILKSLMIILSRWWNFKEWFFSYAFLYAFWISYKTKIKELREDVSKKREQKKAKAVK